MNTRQDCLRHYHDPLCLCIFLFYYYYFIIFIIIRWNESLRYCHDVRPSVCLSWPGVHVIIRSMLARTEVYGWISNVLRTLISKHVHLLPAVFSSYTWKRGGAWMRKLGKALNANCDQDLGCGLLRAHCALSLRYLSFLFIFVYHNWQKKRNADGID